MGESASSSSSASAASESRLQLFTSLYERKSTPWHRSDVNPSLEKYLKLLGPAPSAFNMVPAIRKVFVPLCGKSLDIMYLLGQGYHVFGIEGVKKAIEDFIHEHKLDMMVDEEMSVYFTTGNKLVIYCGDILKCPIDKFGPFQAVWDCGGLGAIGYDEREEYAKVIRSGLREGKYLCLK